MSRPLRIEYENAYYHVMNRGRGRQMIFHGAKYYDAFLNTLSEAHERFGLQVHAYCLMGNHYHLLVKTPEGNLQRAMRHVNGVYTQRYNRLKKTDGSLFRGRYKSILVDADEYLLHLSRYIHKNPEEARLAERLADYEWSSYPHYAGLCGSPGHWLYTKEVYGQLQVKRLLAKKYRKFVEDGEDREELDIFYGKKRLLPILGDEKFIADSKAASKDFSDESSYSERQSLKPSVEEIIDIVCREFKIDSSEVYLSKKGRGAKNVARSVAMYLSQQVGGYRLTDIARAFSLHHYGGVSNAIFRLKVEMNDNAVLLKRVKVIINRLDP
jgi:putative transposase